MIYLWLWACSGLGCSAPPDEDPMPLSVTVNTAEELAALNRQLASANESLTVRVQPGPGPVDGVAWTIGDRFSQVRHELHIDGQESIWSRSALTVIGSVVQVEGLRLHGGPSSGPPLRVHADQSIALRDVLLQNLPARRQKRGATSRGGAIELKALADGVQATLVEVSVIHSAQPIQFVAKPGGRFARIELQTVRLYEVAVPSVVLGPVQQVQIDTVEVTHGAHWLSSSTSLTFIDGDPVERETSSELESKWREGRW